jgi:hypothetical protein
MFVEKFASNIDFTDSKRSGTWVLCLRHGRSALSLYAKRSLVRVCQQRMTAVPRTDLS